MWYLPPAGAPRSYVRGAGAILPGVVVSTGLVGPWTYAVLLLVVLPGLALASSDASRWQRRLAERVGDRRLAAWLFAIAAVKPADLGTRRHAGRFQAPDEVDHFAYTQSLVERGRGRRRDP